MSGHLYVTWDQYHSLIERLVLIVADSGWEFDTVMGLSRGGLRAADVASRVLRKPFAVVAASSYRDEGGTVQGHLALSANIATTAEQLGPRILLIDDLADSGHTLSAVVPHLQTMFPNISEIRTAVLWVKGVSTFTPTYFAEFLPDSPWIHQPFECYDDELDVYGIRSRHS
jgi:hypothetical protein